MTKFAFRTAKRRTVQLRVGMVGQSGHGKTRTLLQVLCHGADLLEIPRSSVGLIDSEVTAEDEQDEQGSAEKYEGEPCLCAQCVGQGITLEGFQVLLLPAGKQSPDDYTQAVAAARSAGIKILGLDSISHEWEAAKRLKDQISANSSANDWTAWSTVTPMHERFIRSMQAYPGHVFATMRGKEKHEQTPDRKVKSLGVLPVQRPMIEYEFDFIAFLSSSNANLVKSRASTLNQRHYDRPGKALVTDLLAWASTGDAAKQRAHAKAQEAQEFMRLDAKELLRQLDGLAASCPPDAFWYPQGQPPQALRPAIKDLKARATSQQQLAGAVVWAKTMLETAAEQSVGSGPAPAPPPPQQKPSAPQEGSFNPHDSGYVPPGYLDNGPDQSAGARAEEDFSDFADVPF